MVGICGRRARERDGRTSVGSKRVGCQRELHRIKEARTDARAHCARGTKWSAGMLWSRGTTEAGKDRPGGGRCRTTCGRKRSPRRRERRRACWVCDGDIFLNFLFGRAGSQLPSAIRAADWPVLGFAWDFPALWSGVSPPEIAQNQVPARRHSLSSATLGGPRPHRPPQLAARHARATAAQRECVATSSLWLLNIHHATCSDLFNRQGTT